LFDKLQGVMFSVKNITCLICSRH